MPEDHDKPVETAAVRPLKSREDEAAEELRHDAQHRTVDRYGIAYTDDGPNPPMREAAIGGDRGQGGGMLDPYHPDDPGEASAQDSPARPKAPAVNQVTEDGRLYRPRPPRSKPD